MLSVATVQVSIIHLEWQSPPLLSFLYFPCLSQGRKPHLIKNNRLLPINQHTMLNVCPYSSGQNDHLEVTTFSNKILDGISVPDPNDILFNNRSFIKLSCSIVCGCSDDLHASLVRLVIRFSSCKGRKKRMVNINDRAFNLV